ncbi:UD11 glucuronosyltransferase, partial [Probosciger aterrimus]|nr:UD11 glucuronosyltransferase [Probosciger aterrimus]
LVLLLSFWSLAEGGKLLVMPQDGSHWLSMRVVLEKLWKRGHEVTAVIPDAALLLKSSQSFTIKTYSVPYTQEFVDEFYNSLGEMSFTKPSLLDKITLFSNLSELTNMYTTSCRHLLYDEELMKYLQDSKFDAIMMDPVLPCGPIIAEYLSLPSVYFMRGLPCHLDYKAAQCPSPSSYVPKTFTYSSDNMTFAERVKNFLFGVSDHVFCDQFYLNYKNLASEFLHREVTILQLFSQASIYLMRYDFVFEYPRPIMPNMVYVGGINCKQKQPLSKEFEAIVNASGEHGIVVFSLGSMVSEIPMKKAKEIADALGTVPQTVLWRYTGKLPPDMPKNIKLIKWLPQNDLLAHPKTRAFITHGGSHGIYEGLCNAVPMLMMPLFGDQMDNAKRIESRGGGLTLDILEMTTQDISAALHAVINDKKYKENIKRLSDLHLDRPIHPMDLAVHWVEFVMRHKGAPHLRPAAHDLNWIQYHSLDVIAFLLAVTFLSLFISLKCCLFCCRRCCCKKGRMRKPTKAKSH